MAGAAMVEARAVGKVAAMEVEKAGVAMEVEKEAEMEAVTGAEPAEAMAAETVAVVTEEVTGVDQAAAPEVAPGLGTPLKAHAHRSQDWCHSS